MITYKGSLWIVIRNLLYGIGGSSLVTLIASCFLEFKIVFIIGAVVFSCFIYLALAGNSTNIVIKSEELSFYKQNKLKHRFNINKVDLYAKIRTQYGGSDCFLIVIEENRNQIVINCSMLGKNRFRRLLSDLCMAELEPIAIQIKAPK